MQKKIFFVSVLLFLGAFVSASTPYRVFARVNNDKEKEQAIQTTADRVQDRFANYQQKLQSWVDRTNTQLNQQEKESQTATTEQPQPKWQRWLRLKKIQKILFGHKQHTQKQDEKVRAKLEIAQDDLKKADDLGKDAVTQLRAVGSSESAKDAIRRAQKAYIQV